MLDNWSRKHVSNRGDIPRFFVALMFSVLLEVQNLILNAIRNELNLVNLIARESKPYCKCNNKRLGVW